MKHILMMNTPGGRRAHLLERAGERAAAVELYRRAAERTASTPERNYLLLHAARLADDG